VLKFLRKYQKWMLAVFCVGLMIAFLIPQANKQFGHDPAESVLGTTYDGRTVTRSDLQRVSSDLQIMRRLRFDPLPLPGLALLPNSDKDTADAMFWTLIQHAADHNHLGASQQEAFTFAASLIGAETMEQLESKAKEAGLNAPYLMDLAKQYLKAEQYRQLVMGVEYTAPGEEEGATGSPGLRRLFAINDTMEAARAAAQQYQQLGLPENQAQGLALQMAMVQGGGLDRIIGHERVTSNQVRHLLQHEYTSVDLSVAVLNADKLIETVGVDDAEVQGIFDRFADDAPGTGQPYGLGYREPNKVKLEALRVPIDAMREKIAKQISSEDIRAFYNEHPSDYLDKVAPAEGEAAGASRLTPEMREEIRVTLTAMRAEQKAVEIAQQIRLRLNDDARGLPNQGAYKVLPAGFVPTPLVVVAEEIKKEHGIDCEVIQVDEPVSAQEIGDSLQFTQSWIATLPTSTVRVPNVQFGFLMERQLPEVTLSGRAGLFATIAPELSNASAGQAMPLAVYVRTAQPFVRPDTQEAAMGLQVGLPGRILIDVTRSTYVFRLTDAIASRPAPELGPIAEQVRADARKVKAYEALVAKKDELLRQAAEQPFAQLMNEAGDKQTLSGVMRTTLRQPTPIQGVTNSGMILQQAFGTADQVMATTGFDAASEKDRVFAVELPGDYKIALVRVDGYRSITQKSFQEQANDPATLLAATQMGAKPYEKPPLSIEAMMSYTGFKWAEGFGPSVLGTDKSSAQPEGEEAPGEAEGEPQPE